MNRSSRSSGSTRRFGRVALILLIVLAALAIAAPAAFAGSGAIEGTVTAANMVPTQPLINIAVIAIPVRYADGSSVDSHRPEPVFTDAAGHYFINGLPDGLYHVKFFDPTRHPMQWATQWYNGVNWWIDAPSAAADVVVVPNMVTSGIDAALYMTSDISGYVHDWHGNALEDIQVWPWYDGVGISWWDFVTAIETGRFRGGAMENAANDDRPHIPEWIRDRVAWTDPSGYYEITNLEPANGTIAPYGYKVYFHDPSKAWASEWWDDRAPWAGGDLVAVDPGVDTTGIDATLSASGCIDGHVDGDLGNGYEYDLSGVRVLVFAGDDPEVLMGTDVTDEYGYYEIDGLPMGTYTVVFDADTHALHETPYYSQEFNGVEVHPTDCTELCALLRPIPYIAWIHPPFGVNDGPDRYTTHVEYGGWGLYWLTDWALVKDEAPLKFWEISFDAGNLLENYVTNSDGTMGEAVFNLAAPLAPTGTYDLFWEWDNPWTVLPAIDELDRCYQVVNSYVAPQPATPSPTAIPTLPATPTPITPAPTPTPTLTPEPVAGPITVAAPYASVVKRGKVATLRFRVNEAVLGGTAAVKVSIKNKAGVAVKNVAAKVTMNADASISFKCKLPKGKYTFFVSAADSSASNTLTVK